MTSPIQQRQKKIKDLKRRAQTARQRLNLPPRDQLTRLLYLIPDNFLEPVNGHLSQPEYIAIAQYLQTTVGDIEIPIRSYYWSALLNWWKPSLSKKILQSETWNTVDHLYVNAPPDIPAAPPRRGYGKPDVIFPHVLLAGTSIMDEWPTVKYDEDRKSRVYDIAFTAASMDATERHVEEWFVTNIIEELSPRSPTVSRVYQWLTQAKEQTQLPGQWGAGHFNPDVIISAAAQYFKDFASLTQDQKNAIIRASIPKAHRPRSLSQPYLPSDDLRPGQLTLWPDIYTGAEAVWKAYQQFATTTQSELDDFKQFLQQMVRTRQNAQPHLRTVFWRETLDQMPTIHNIMDKLPSTATPELLLESQTEAAAVRLLAAYFTAWENLVARVGAGYFSYDEIAGELTDVLSEFDLWKYIHDADTFRLIFFNQETDADIPWVRPTQYNIKRIWTALNLPTVQRAFRRADEFIGTPAVVNATDQILKAVRFTDTPSSAMAPINKGLLLTIIAEAAAIGLAAKGGLRSIGLTPGQNQYIELLDTQRESTAAYNEFMKLNRLLDKLLLTLRAYDVDPDKFTPDKHQLIFTWEKRQQTLTLKNDHDYPIICWLQPPPPIFYNQRTIFQVDPHSTYKMIFTIPRKLYKKYLGTRPTIHIDNLVDPIHILTRISYPATETSVFPRGTITFLDRHKTPPHALQSFKNHFVYAIPKDITLFTFKIRNDSDTQISLRTKPPSKVLTFQNQPWTLEPGQTIPITVNINRPPKLWPQQTGQLEKVVFQFAHLTVYTYWDVKY